MGIVVPRVVHGVVVSRVVHWVVVSRVVVTGAVVPWVVILSPSGLVQFHLILVQGSQKCVQGLTTRTLKSQLLG